MFEAKPMNLVILDRDGVINEDSDAYIKTPAECLPVPGSLDAIARLHQAGFTVVVASNQSGIARGLFSPQTLSAIQQKLTSLAREAGGAIDAFFICPHGPEDGCDCRKPKPGLLHQIEQHYHTRLTGVPVIGDSLRDLQAARSVGAIPILVRTGKGRQTEAAGKGLEGVAIFDNLATAVAHLLGHPE